MTRTIDIPTYQTAVVRNCSPTLAGIKPASLFTYPGVYANQNGKPGAAHIEERRSRLLAVIARYKVYIDGHFVLFGLKKGILVIQDPEKVKRGVPHRAEVTVTDECGNVTRKEYRF